MSHEEPGWLVEGAVRDAQSITKDWMPSTQRLIDGVFVREVRPVLTKYGHLTEVLRQEWLPAPAAIGQVFASTVHPGGLSAWHAHGVTTDRLFVVAGQLRVVLYDARTDSPTYGMVNEVRLGVQRPMLVVVPPRVWHGIQNAWSETAVVLNAVDQGYAYDHPDHWRVPADSPTIPYRFA